MKKTFIALFALAGLASASDSLTLDNAVAAFVVENGSITSVMGDFTRTDNTLTLNNGNKWGADVSTDRQRTEMTVALTVDMAKLASLEGATKLLSLGSWGIGAVPATDAARLSGTWNSNPDYYHTDAFDATGYRDFVVTLASSGTRIFNGSTAVYYTNTGLKGDTNSTDLIITDALLNGAVLKAVIWSEGAYEADAKSASAFTALVQAPEPATATLSLLALAGLASRRRRH